MATRLAPVRPARALRPEPTPAPAGPRHLRVVPADFQTAQARQRRARRLVVLAGAGIAAALFAIVAFHVVLTQSELDLLHLQSSAQAGSVRQQQLRLQVAQLESPERIVDAAQKLGMVPPVTVHYLTPGAAPVSPVPAPKPPAPSPSAAAAPKATTQYHAPTTVKPTATTVPAAKPATATKPATTTPKPSATTPTTTAVRKPAR